MTSKFERPELVQPTPSAEDRFLAFTGPILKGNNQPTLIGLDPTGAYIRRVGQTRDGLKKTLGGRPVAVDLLLSNDPNLLAARDKLGRADANAELLAECAVLVCDCLLKFVLGDCPHSLAAKEEPIQDARA
jgi:hypothetical protein